MVVARAHVAQSAVQSGFNAGMQLIVVTVHTTWRAQPLGTRVFCVYTAADAHINRAADSGRVSPDGVNRYMF